MVTRSTFRAVQAVALLVCLVVLPAQGFTQPPPPSAPPPVVKRIEVSGNARIPADQILTAVTETKVGDPVGDEKIRADARAINDLGWFADVSARLEPEQGGVAVIFLVTENPVIADVVIEGNTVLSTSEIQAALGVPAGEVLNLKKMRDGARAVQKLYEEKGFGLARIADLSILPADRPNEARLRVRISEGIVERVRFEGLQKTHPAVAQRYVRETRAGGPFDVNALQRDLQRLFDSGLFESIRARPEPGTSPDSAVIVLEVKEARTTTASFGLGYSSSEGLLGFIEYRDRNWQGRAQSFAVRAERAVQDGSTDRLNYEVSFTEPFLDASGTGLDLSMFSRDSIEREYNPAGAVTSRFSLQRDGAIVALSRLLDGVTTGSIRLRTELTNFTPVPIDPADVPPFPPCGLPTPCPPLLLSPGRVVSVQLSTVRDTRDSRLTPTAGDKLVVSAELAPLWLGGDFDFTKYSVDYQRLFPTGGGATIVTRLLGGASSGSLPLQDRFVLGGPSTVRGLPSGSKRETSILVANVEYRFPLSGLIPSFTDVGMILFVDSGAAPLTNVPVIGYGVGIALNTPLGPIRIDLAWGPDGTRQTWLSLGAPF